MYFTSESSGVEVASVDMNEGEVSVYSLDGTMVGNFGSSAQALSAIPQGTYIIKTSDNKTIKIAVQ